MPLSVLNHSIKCHFICRHANFFFYIFGGFYKLEKAGVVLPREALPLETNFNVVENNRPKSGKIWDENCP